MARDLNLWIGTGRLGKPEPDEQKAYGAGDEDQFPF